MTELRTVDFRQGKFECDGKEFTISAQVPSFDRYAKFEQYKVEFFYSRDLLTMLKDLERAEGAMNKLKFTDTAVILNNIRTGVYDIATKYPLAFRICALCINEKGEDITDASDELINAKIACWNKELDPSPFFHFAASTLREWIAAFELNSLDTLKAEPEQTKGNGQ